MKIYRDFDQTELDRQYDARGASPDGQSFRDFIREESPRIKKRLGGAFDLPYGPGEAELLDIFPAEEPGAPVMFFIHGGYWRSSSKDDVGLFAATFVPAGATYVAINYALAPGAAIDEIVRQCRAGLAWVYRNIADYNGDPDRIHINGRSAGGHLAGMLLAGGWQEDFGVPVDVVKGACAVSGLYDLEPVQLSSVNDWARMDAASARRNSPIHHLPEAGCPLIVTYGGLETDEFKRQTEDYMAAWRGRGFPCSYVDMPGRHHFATMPEFMDPDSLLTRAALDQMGLGLKLNSAIN
ncbi:MAG: alpha/beta hydrolase [Alphaproteobacteria bacterium]